MKAKAVSEGKLYFTTSVTDEETYEEHERLWSAPLEGGKAESLAQYEEPKAPEGADSIRRSVNSMAASGVGLWLYETVNGTVYELPEGFSGEEYEKYDYAKDVSERRLRLVDAATGAEKLTAELDKALDAVKSTLQLPDDELCFLNERGRGGEPLRGVQPDGGGPLFKGRGAPGRKAAAWLVGQCSTAQGRKGGCRWQ